MDVGKVVRKRTMANQEGPQPGYPDRRDRAGGSWRRIGMIVPSSNTVLEPETMRLVAPLGDRVSIHFARVGVTQISTSEQSSAQFGLAGMIAAAELLAGTRPDAILWNGTAASWLGLARDEALAARMAEATGTACTTTMLLYRAAFAAMGIRRLALVTPYTAEIQSSVLANLGGLGIDIVAERHLGDAGNFSYAEYSDGFVANELRAAIETRQPDAAAVMCTNYRGARAAADIEAELGIPVLDSVALTLWGALALAEIATSELAIHGRLFAELPASAAREAAFWPSPPGAH
jgi:maleate isomerase